MVAEILQSIVAVMVLGPFTGLYCLGDSSLSPWFKVGYCLALPAMISLLVWGVVAFSARRGKVALCFGILLWFVDGLFGMRYVVT